MDVILLPSNRPPDRFYRGGRKISEFRGEPPAGPREPEDWVGSTTTLAGEVSLGRTVLPDGEPLIDAVTGEPLAWLGRDHLERYGPDTKLLVKLLDAGQRLLVHAHPHVEFAHRHLGRAHGKAEAWYMLDGGEVHLGLRTEVSPERLAALVADQDVGGLLGLMHRVEVRPHDVVYVPPGVLHAIGAGVFLVEVQEPEDLSILLEWRDFALDGVRDGHLGLGFDLALQAVESRARSSAQIAELVRATTPGPSVLPPAAEEYFVLERVSLDGEATLAPGFAVAVTLTGDAELDGSSARLSAGSTALVPHAFGELRLRGRAELVICRPPAASGHHGLPGEADRPLG